MKHPKCQLPACRDGCIPSRLRGLVTCPECERLCAQDDKHMPTVTVALRRAMVTRGRGAPRW